MTDELRIYFGFRSPYSRLGLHKVVRADLPKIIPTRCIPFTGPAGGAAFFDPLSSPPKLAYYAEDAPRMAARMDLGTQLPDPFDVSMTRANKAFLAADKLGKGLPFALAVSDARWGEGKNISDIEVLTSCAVASGLDEGLAKQAKTDASLDRDLTACAVLVDRDQVFGVPFAVLEKAGRTQKFWGQDRFDLLIEFLNT